MTKQAITPTGNDNTRITPLAAPSLEAKDEEGESTSSQQKGNLDLNGKKQDQPAQSSDITGLDEDDEKTMMQEVSQHDDNIDSKLEGSSGGDDEKSSVESNKPIDGVKIPLLDAKTDKKVEKQIWQEEGVNDHRTQGGDIIFQDEEILDLDEVSTNSVVRPQMEASRVETNDDGTNFDENTANDMEKELQLDDQAEVYEKSKEEEEELMNENSSSETKVHEIAQTEFEEVSKDCKGAAIVEKIAARIDTKEMQSDLDGKFDERKEKESKGVYGDGIDAKEILVALTEASDVLFGPRLEEVSKGGVDNDNHVENIAEAIAEKALPSQEEEEAKSIDNSDLNKSDERQDEQAYGRKITEESAGDKSSDQRSMKPSDDIVKSEVEEAFRDGIDDVNIEKDTGDEASEKVIEDELQKKQAHKAELDTPKNEQEQDQIDKEVPDSDGKSSHRSSRRWTDLLEKKEELTKKNKTKSDSSAGAATSLSEADSGEGKDHPLHIANSSGLQIVEEGKSHGSVAPPRDSADAMVSPPLAQNSDFLEENKLKAAMLPEASIGTTEMFTAQVDNDGDESESNRLPTFSGETLQIPSDPKGTLETPSEPQEFANFIDAESGAEKDETSGEAGAPSSSTQQSDASAQSAASSTQNSTAQESSARPGLQRSDPQSINSLSDAMESKEAIENVSRPGLQRSKPHSITSLSETIETKEGVNPLSETDDLGDKASSGEGIKQMTLRSGRVLRGGESKRSSKDEDDQNELPATLTGVDSGKPVDYLPDPSPKHEQAIEGKEDAISSTHTTTKPSRSESDLTNDEGSNVGENHVENVNLNVDTVIAASETAKESMFGRTFVALPNNRSSSDAKDEAVSFGTDESTGKAVEKRECGSSEKGEPRRLDKPDQNTDAGNQGTRIANSQRNKPVEWNSFLFDGDDSYVESEQIVSSRLYVNGTSGLPYSRRKERHIEEEGANPLRNPKKAFDFLLMRLSGDERDREEGKADMYLDAGFRRSRDIKRSVFAADELKPEIRRSISPPGSPPEGIPYLTEESEEGSDTLTQEGSIEEEDGEFFWDLVPERGVVDAEPEMRGIDEDQNSKRSLSFLFEASQKTARSQPTSADPPAGPFDSSKRLQKSRSRRSGLDARSIPKSLSGSDPKEQLFGDNDGGVTPVSVSVPGSLTVHWNSSENTNFPADEEMTEGFDKDDVLDEALLAFSSLDDVGFLKQIPQLPVAEKPPKDLPPLVWRQLLSRWKHCEMWKAMLSRPSSLYFRSLTENQDVPNDSDTVSSASTIQLQFNGRRIIFSSALSWDDTFSVFRNLSGFQPHADDGEVVLSGLLCELGPKSVSLPRHEDDSSLKQALPSREAPGEKEGPIDVSGLLKNAETHLEGFTNIVKSVVAFASLNDHSSSESDSPEIAYTVGLKNYSSVKRKAARRYDGDIMLVKDILRAQITFPDDGSLICGLYHLWEIAQGSKESGHDKSAVPSFEIVRFKNLFRTSDFGNTYYPALPTGYRHILINLRIQNTVVAGKKSIAPESSFVSLLCYMYRTSFLIFLG